MRRGMTTTNKLDDAALAALTPDQFNDAVYNAKDVVRYARLRGIVGEVVGGTRRFVDTAYIIGAVRHEIRSARPSEKVS